MNWYFVDELFVSDEKLLAKIKRVMNTHCRIHNNDNCFGPTFKIRYEVTWIPDFGGGWVVEFFTTSTRFLNDVRTVHDLGFFWDLISGLKELVKKS